MKLIIFSALLLLSFGTYAQQPGSLDKSFGTNGTTVTDFGKQSSPSIFKGVLQSDDKIIETGYYTSSIDGPSGPFAVRYTADGVIDSSYGDKGKSIIEIPFVEEVDAITGTAITPSNELLISGYGFSNYRNPVYDGIMLELKKDGSLDSSFGKNGLIQFNVDGYGEYDAITVQDDGKILVLGGKGSGRSGIVFLSRLLPNGAVDETFGDQGYATITTYSAFFSIKEQADHKILLAGYDYTFGAFDNRRFCLQRYLPDGTLDKGFGDGGTVNTAYGDDAFIHDIGLQSDGKIVATGEVTYNSPYNTYFATARYTADGILDASFGTEGKATTLFGDSGSIASSLAIQKDDKIILGGGKGLNSVSNIAIVRLTPDGGRDSSFGGSGEAYGDTDRASSVASVLLQSDNKIVAAGSEFLTTHYGTSLSRYNNGISQRQRIVTRIKRYLQHHGITWQTDAGVRYYTVQRSVDGGVTYQPLAKLWNNHQPVLTYEDASATGDNAVYRVAVVAKDGGRSFSNAIALTNEAGVRVFPNPVRSTLQVQGLPATGRSSLDITDFSGTVRTSTITNGGTASLNTSSLKPGNYLLKVQNGNTVETKAFVKE